MAADSLESRQDRHGSIVDPRETSVAAPTFDPSLEPMVKRLFEQHANTDAKISALLPSRALLNPRLELERLRYKLGALETYAASQSMSLSPFYSSPVTLIIDGSSPHSLAL